MKKISPLFLKHYTSFLITSEVPPGIHTIKDISEVVYTKSDHEETLQIEYDDISMKTKLILTRFGLTFRTYYGILTNCYKK